ncbi:MAG TPA: hypothetical protein VF707_04590 [Ardenticatenaceae bacterium]|jgi:NTP pyrophosphatase (non-canonical NTP hydrolase)
MVFDKLPLVSRGLTRKFPRGDDPFQLMTRLLEECGELAQEVNRFEGSGIKHEKHGAPNRERLTEEASHALRALFQIVQYYQMEEEVAAALEATYERLQQAGYIDQSEFVSSDETRS